MRVEVIKRNSPIELEEAVNEWLEAGWGGLHKEILDIKYSVAMNTSLS